MIAWLRCSLPKELIGVAWHLPRALVAAVWFRFPARRLTCVAVAGTKGKTTTTVLLTRMLIAAGERVACVSTAVVRCGDREELNAEKMTTPSTWWLQRFLRRAVDTGSTHAVLEVSSHALVQRRTFGIPWTIVVLTNLAPDHLEYHRDAADYRASHRALLCSPRLHTVVVNGDDPHLASFRSRSGAGRIFTARSPLADRMRSLPLALPGEHHVANALAAATAAEVLGVPWDAIARALRDPLPIPGRLERIDAGQPFTVIVDYAHSPESLAACTDAVAAIPHGRTIVVFGACGERDASQRPMMGHILDERADIVIVTNDDPYGEDPTRIASGLLTGIARKVRDRDLHVILDRRAAIATALDLARSGDLVLILGKGAEQWQVFAGRRIPWDDRAVVREELARRGDAR